MKSPAHIRRGKSIGGVKPPRRGCPSEPTSDINESGRKFIHVQIAGTGSPSASFCPLS